MIAISTMSYMLLKPSEALAMLNDVGVDEVELSFDNFQFFRKLGVSYDSMMASILDIKTTLKCRVVAAHLPYGELINRAVNPSEQPKVLSELSKWLRLFSELGVKTVAVHIPFNYASIDEDSLTYPRRIKEANMSFFKTLASLGREFSLTLAVENRYERGVYGYLPKDLVDLISYVGEDNLKICLDTGHSIINGFQPHEYYKLLHPNVVLIHAHDNDGSKDLHLPPYMGCIDWDAFLNTLRELKYNGIIVLEVACSDSIRRCNNTVNVLKMISKSFAAKLSS
ncbi:MAG: sugar phosphate isomerase/epimerase family protein [Sulfolobales archaeon]